MTDTDAACELNKGDAGYDPVVEAEELEKLLWPLQHGCEDSDRNAKRSVI